VKFLFVTFCSERCSRRRYVDCWDGRAIVKSCNPKTLVFDESSGQCQWAGQPAVRGLCQGQEQPQQHRRQRQTTPRFSASALCPGDYSGPASYPPDCTKFANCWKGSPTIQVNIVALARVSPIQLSFSLARLERTSTLASVSAISRPKPTAFRSSSLRRDPRRLRKG